MKTSTLARTFKLSVLSAAIALVSLNASAALYDRGNGMIYDSTLNITWLQDANYARTSGYDDDGMLWFQAKNWANDLIYGGFDDWRLPSARLIGNSAYRVDGSTDFGYNITRSELGHLFNELGNKSKYTITGVLQSPRGWKNSSFFDLASGQIKSFQNVSFPGYWMDEATVAPWGDQSAWYMYFGDGSQYPLSTLDEYANEGLAWAVRDGDVLPVNEVPVPAAAWLLGSGLIGLAGLARRKK